VKENQIVIPYHEFKDFVYKRVFGKFGLALFSTEKELQKSLEVLKKQGYLKLEEREDEKRIVIGKEEAEIMFSMVEAWINEFLKKDSLERRIGIVKEYYMRLFLSGLSDEQRGKIKEKEYEDNLGRVYLENLRELERILLES